MDRRKFLLGTGALAAGGASVLGSGAFSRVESHRNVTIQVARDPDAYLGLDKCDTPNGSYVDIDDHGHLEVLMNDENPTIEDTPLGEGVNSDSRTWFDNVFQVCNQGKEDVCLYIENDDDDWPWYDGERRVDFYVSNHRERSLVGQPIGLAVGECVCVGIRTTTKDLSEGDELLGALDNEVTIVADVDQECPRPDNGIPPEEDAFPAFQLDLAWGDPIVTLDSENNVTYSNQERLLVWQHGVADNEAKGASALAGENGNWFGNSGRTLGFDQFFETLTHVKFLDAGGDTVFEWDGDTITSLGSETPVEAEIEFEMADDVAGKAEDLYDDLDNGSLTENEQRALEALYDDEEDDYGVQVSWVSYGGEDFGWNTPEFQMVWGSISRFKDSGTKTMTVDLPPLQ